MNFLGHLYLSGDNDEIIIGNFIADFVKGKKYLNYSKGIQKGILLHRQIDSFTDSHPSIKKSASLLREEYHKYAYVVIDIFSDYFLASQWDKYHTENLSDFTNKIYRILMRDHLILPLKMQAFLPSLIKDKRLESYCHIEGIRETLQIMERRTSLPEKSDYAIKILNTNYNILKYNFDVFINDARKKYLTANS